MKKVFILAAALSATAALAACDRSDGPAALTNEPANSVTMPSPAPAPQNNLDDTSAVGAMGSTMNDPAPLEGAPAAPLQ